MKKGIYVLFGIMLLLTLFSATASISKPPILPPPKDKCVCSSGWVDEIFGNEAHFAEIKANINKFSKHSTREAIDITRTNSLLYSIQFSDVQFDKDFFTDYYQQYKVRSS